MELSTTALRSLFEVAQRGTMTAAAEYLGYTPGAVSQHIATLAKAVGRPLVEPAGRGIRLTDAGLIVAEHARRVLESQSTVEFALAQQEAAVAGVLRVGAFGSSAVLLADAVTRLRERFPALTIAIREQRETTTDNAVLAVSRGESDVALALDYPDHPLVREETLDVQVLAREHFGVSGLEADGAEVVSLRSLASLDWVLPPEDSAYGRAMRGACRRLGFEPHARHLVTDTAMALRLTAAGLGVSFATPLMMRFAQPGTKLQRIDEAITRDIVLVSRRGDERRHAIEALRTALVESMAQ